MKVFKITNLSVLLMLGVFLATCDDNPAGSDSVMDADEAKQNVTKSVETTTNNAEQAANGGFMTMTENFAGGSLQQNASLEWTFPMVDAAGNVINFDQIETNHRFDFDANTGVYTWNHQDSVWEESSSDQIVFNFPGSEQASQNGNNNMSMSLSDYSDALVTIDGADYYLPQSMLFEISKEDESQFRFDLNNLQFIDDPDVTFPSNLDLEIFTNPALHTIQLSREEDTRFTFSFESLIEGKDNGRILALDVTANLAHSNYANITDEDFENVAGAMHMGPSMRIDYDVEVGEIAALEDPSENEVNSHMTVEVFYNDTKVGDIEYRDRTEQLVIVYADDSEEPVQKYITQFTQNISDDISNTAAKKSFEYMRSLTK